jgi:succinoglycan biosynthesis transport protein ExoP
MSGPDETNITKTKDGAVLPAWRPQTAGAIPAADSIEIYSSLHTYWDILIKHRWLIFTVAFALTAVTSTYSILTKPEYRATARIVIEPDSQDMQTVNNLGRNNIPADDSFLSTQVDVLKSENLAWQTIQQLKLSETPDFAKYLKRSVASTPPTVIQAKLTSVFEDRLIVNRKRDTRMVEVSFDNTNPESASLIVNKLVNNYIEYNFRTKYGATRQATTWMEQRLAELKKGVETSQRALVDYEQRNSIVNVGDKESVVEQKLADLNHDLTQAQSDRMEKESVSKLATSTNSQVGTVAQNTVLPRLEERNADLREQYVDALAQYGEDYPKVIRLRKQVNELQTLIDSSRKQTVDQLFNDFAASKSREALLATAVARQKQEVGRINQLLIQHGFLKHDFEMNQQLYDNLLQRLKDANVSAGLRATNIHIVDEATPIPTPVRPRKIRNSAIGLLAGLILGFFAAMMIEVLDHSVRSAEEIERLVSVPALAMIPLQSGPPMHRHGLSSRRSGADAKVPKDNGLTELAPAKKHQNDGVELALLHNPGSAVSESFRALRTSLLMQAGAHPPQAILVTSAQPGEGKTCVSLNLAVAFAQMGSRVIIIDADFHRPRVGSSLTLPNDKGLSDVLIANHFQPTDKTGSDCVHESIRQLEMLDNLWVLPSGSAPPNPAELLTSPTMKYLLERLRHQFDHVIIDSPPVLLISDGLILSSKVDGVIIVVKNEKTQRGALRRACRMVTDSGGNILGVVLNKVNMRTDGYYGHYSYKGNNLYDMYTSESAQRRS